MANKIIEYLDVIESVYQDMADNVLTNINDADDGMVHTVPDGKQVAIDNIEANIQRLTRLRNDVAMLPLTRLKKQHQCPTY